MGDRGGIGRTRGAGEREWIQQRVIVISGYSQYSVVAGRRYTTLHDEPTLQWTWGRYLGNVRLPSSRVCFIRSFASQCCQNALQFMLFVVPANRSSSAERRAEGTWVRNNRTIMGARKFVVVVVCCTRPRSREKKTRSAGATWLLAFPRLHFSLLLNTHRPRVSAMSFSAHVSVSFSSTSVFIFIKSIPDSIAKYRLGSLLTPYSIARWRIKK